MTDFCCDPESGEGPETPWASACRILAELTGAGCVAVIVIGGESGPGGMTVMGDGEHLAALPHLLIEAGRQILAGEARVARGH